MSETLVALGDHLWVLILSTLRSDILFNCQPSM